METFFSLSVLMRASILSTADEAPVGEFIPIQKYTTHRVLILMFLSIKNQSSPMTNMSV